MYFDDNLPPTWDLKEAFLQYYEKYNKDFSKTLSSIKSDLMSLTVKPTVLKSVKTAAENHITRWTKLSNKFKSYAEELEVGNQEDSPAQQAASPFTNVTNNYITNTNRDRATFNQTVVNNNVSGSNASVSNNRGKKRQNEEEKPFLFEKVNPNYYENDNKSWTINNIDIGIKFQKYQTEVSKNAQSKNMLVETDTHEILALSNVLLIKNKQESPMYKEFFSEHEVELIETEVKKKFGIDNNYRLESLKRSTLEDIIFDLRQKKNNYKISYKTINRDTF